MDGDRFDSLARSVGISASRRGALRVLVTAAIAAPAARVGLGSDPAAAKDVTTEQRFGCLRIGEACNGRSGQCCSGRCKGKKARRTKKGRKRRDRSRCVAHDEGSCTTSQDTCATGLQVACGRGNRGGCFITTGDAPFCGQITGQSPPAFNCIDCNRDRDCDDLGYGPGAACVICEQECRFLSRRNTACIGPED
jgi:hypothetical protein